MILIKPIADLMKMARHRPEAYVADVLSKAESVDQAAGTYQITEERWGELVLKYRRAWCKLCDGPHATKDCPIPPDTSPEIERRRAVAGGCCGAPTS